MPTESASAHHAAALYDVLNSWGPSDDFYLRLVMSAGSALDVGCGTGVLLHRARDSGHRGRLVGLDPDPVMLARARTRSDIEWTLRDAASADWDQEFELAVMASHAFQFLVEDDDLRESLAAIRAALVDGGRFAFETRNPLVRAWESWNPTNAFKVVGPDGTPLRIEYDVETPVVGDVVHVTETTSSPDWAEPVVERASLRFLSVDALNTFLAEAGFVVDEQHGDWKGGPVATSSNEIITVARRA
jgi:SAM-dependent methyltransferase